MTRTVLGEGTRVPPTVSALLLRTGRRGRAVWSGVGTQTGLSGANHFDSEFFLVVYTLFSQDGWQREGFWEVGEQGCLLLTFLKLFWLVEAY